MSGSDSDITYVTGLPVIAEKFERLAEAADHYGASTTRVGDRRLSQREAFVWRQAADIIRHTRLVNMH